VSRRAAVTAAVLAGAGLACAGLIAGCGSQPTGVTGAGPPPLTAPLSTSLVTAQGTWAVASMGGRDADDRFWQLFFRPAGTIETVPTAGSVAAGQWALPPVPAGTEVLAPAGTGTLAPGTGGSYDALAVAGSRLTVWRLAQGAWAKVQQVTVPLQYGSSG
jgi:hypothetical protein